MILILAIPMLPALIWGLALTSPAHVFLGSLVMGLHVSTSMSVVSQRTSAAPMLSVKTLMGALCARVMKDSVEMVSTVLVCRCM